MAMSSTTLLLLVLLGFIMLFVGFPWWAGVGVIVASMALAVGDDTATQNYGRVAAAMPVSGQKSEKPWWVKEAEAEPNGSFLDPLKFRPSIPPDGIAKIGSISTPAGERVPGDPGNVSVGKRTGAASIYADTNTNGPRIRIKEDFRFHPEFMNIKDPYTGIKPFTNLVTMHFRTNKPILKTKGLDKTFDSWDKELWDNPDWDLDMDD